MNSLEMSFSALAFFLGREAEWVLDKDVGVVNNNTGARDASWPRTDLSAPTVFRVRWKRGGRRVAPSLLRHACAKKAGGIGPGEQITLFAER